MYNESSMIKYVHVYVFVANDLWPHTVHFLPITSCPPLKIVEGLLIVFRMHGVGAVANRGTCAGNRKAV